MISTLFKFAELLKDKTDLQTYFSPAENPFEGREDKGKVLVGIIDDKNFKGFELENFKTSFINKYLYRKPAGARGTNTVPTLIINRQDPEKTFLDPTCGDGQFLGEVLIRKLENSIPFEEALSTIYGVDLMQDNVDLCRERLLCGREDLRHIVERNIVCADAIEYNYTFGEPEVFGNGLFTVAE
jgi:hypothetical protein